MQTKICRVLSGGCGRDLALTEFHVNNVRTNGSVKYRPICKDCYRAKARKVNRVRIERRDNPMFERTLPDELFAPYPQLTGRKFFVDETHPSGEGLKPDNGRHHLQSYYQADSWGHV